MTNTSHILHGFTDLKNLDTHGAIVLNKAEGIYVYDDKGKKYLDANSGLWNSVVGFDHPKMIEAAKIQYEKFSGYHSFFGRISEPAVLLADKLIEISPFNDGKVFFTNSGSEANDTCVKLLWFLNRRKGFKKRTKIITRINSYHGVTVVSSSMTGKPYNSEFGLPLDGFVHAPCPHYWKNSNENESEEDFSKRMAYELEELIKKENPDTIAGFFAEPVMGAGGVIPPSQNYFELIQPILKKYNIPFIADEVICGFGRTGNLWGSETYNINPDIIIASKCITSGFFPLGAVIIGERMTEELMKASYEAEEFPHGFTAGGHPVACALALQAIDIIINEKLIENVRSLEPLFMGGLKAFEDMEFIGEARGIGLMGALEMVQDKKTKQPFDSSLNMGEQVANKAIEKGLICRPLGPSIVLCPPFITTPEEIDTMYSILKETLKEVFNNIR
ncbi:MAG: aspartate aminotransferase family protein [Pelagibacteraceae bacterium]|nr:aspartate aminotransferase family protein [Pelagibacteraceae bacterium]|tara:strand:+ start:2702 stop:4039 length:1338 start_codon:yes stop_codon:yes gene_type:complete